MSKLFRIATLLSVLSLLLTGCFYDCKTYTTTEVLAVYNKNRQLFIDVAQIISMDDDFYVNGRDRDDDDAAAILSSPYDRNMECFSAKNQKTLKKVFDLGPCNLCYYHHNSVVQITFHGPNDDANVNDMVFFCSTDPTDQEGFDNYLKEYSYIANAIVDPLEDGWYFCTY